MKIFSIRNLSYLVVICLGLGIGNPFSLAFADSNETLQAMATVLSVFVKFFTFIALMIMSWGGELMGTEFLTSDAAMEGIRPMWIYIRNITNIGFVLVLMYLAFSNLFSFGNGTWTIKEKLPRVIIAMIAVNFSLVAFRVVLDAINVGSVAILSVADTAVMEQGDFDVSKVLNTYSEKDTGKVCPLSESDKKLLNPAGGGEPNYKAVDANMSAQNCYPFYQVMNELMCTDAEKTSDCFFHIKSPTEIDTKLKEGKPTTSNLMLSFGVYFQHLEQLPALAAKLNDFSGVVDSVLFSSIMALAYVVAIVAVFIALLVRMIALWFFMIFSPLLVAAGIMGIGGGGGDILNKLITYLIMPLKIAAAFALSFVMIAVLIKFEPASSVEILEPGLALKQFAGGNMFGVLWKIVTVVVFWTAAFEAMKGTHVEGFIESVKSKAEGAGQFMAQAATVDQQFLRIGSGKKVSLRSLSRVPEALKNFQTQKNQDDFREMARALDLNNFTEAQNKMVKRLEKIGRSITPTTKKATLEEVRDTTTANDLLNENVRKSLIEALKRSGQFNKNEKDKKLLAQLEKDLASASNPEHIKNYMDKFAENVGASIVDFKNWESKNKNKEGDEHLAIKDSSIVKQGNDNVRFDIGYTTSNDVYETIELDRDGEEFKIKTVSNGKVGGVTKDDRALDEIRTKLPELLEKAGISEQERANWEVTSDGILRKKSTET